MRQSPTLAVMGGVLIKPQEVAFARLLGEALAMKTTLRIIATGYKGFTDGDDSHNCFNPSFAYAVADGAASSLTSSSLPLRLFTSSRSGPPDQTFMLGTKLQPRGWNKKANKQLQLAVEADVVCLAAGKQGTRNLYDILRALDRPVLPLPFFGGSTRRVWFKYHADLVADSTIGAEIAERWSKARLVSRPSGELDTLVTTVIEAVTTAIRLRCLVIMPFANHFGWVYERVISTAASMAYADIVRIDLQHDVGDIPAMFREEVLRADLIVAVVTDDSPNVLYEVGFAHAVGRDVLFLCQDTGNRKGSEPPFYIRNHRIIWYPSQYDEEGCAAAADELRRALSGARRSVLESPSNRDNGSE